MEIIKLKLFSDRSLIESYFWYLHYRNFYFQCISFPDSYNKPNYHIVEAFLMSSFHYSLNQHPRHSMNPTLIPLVVWGERPVTTYPSKSVSSDCPPSFHLPSFLVQRDSSQWYLNETVPENIPSFASLLRSNHSKGLSLLNTQTIGHQHSWIFFATLTLHEIP